MNRPKSISEIKPLLALCKAGKLFEVQDWISSGEPVLLPKKTLGTRWKGPLEHAIESGFYSLVLVLLEGGACTIEYEYDSLDHAIEMKRLDIVRLLFEFNADIETVDIAWTFGTGNAPIAKFLIQKGADVETNCPLAQAMIGGHKAALTIYEKLSKRNKNLKRQINIALRYYCVKGDLEWISLLLKAGANPYEEGIIKPTENDDSHFEFCALELAILNKHHEIFKLKSLKLRPKLEKNYEIMSSACFNADLDMMRLLMEKGIDLDIMGTTFVQELLEHAGYLCGYKKRRITCWGAYYFDFEETREIIRKIHFLARQGFRWEPEGKNDIDRVRRSFLKLSPDYIVEFVWIMTGYKTCNIEDLKALVQPKSIKTMLNKPTQNRIKKLLEAV